jgi:leader peptidase (prepilin peptidase)/N-methyltransferase
LPAPRVVLCALAGLPAGWFVLVLADRIPDAKPLFRPFPKVPFPRERRSDLAGYILCVGLFALGALRFDAIPALVPYLALFMVLIALSLIDIDTLRLPDRLVFPSIAAALVAIAVISSLEYTSAAIAHALVGALLYFGVLLLAHLVYPAGMGFGDVKMSFLMGLFLGWPAGDTLQVAGLVVWAMFIGFGLGSAVGIVVLVFKRRSTPYPFGPFLALGAVAGMLLAEGLVPQATKLIF